MIIKFYIFYIYIAFYSMPMPMKCLDSTWCQRKNGNGGNGHGMVRKHHVKPGSERMKSNPSSSSTRKATDLFPSDHIWECGLAARVG